MKKDPAQVILEHLEEEIQIAAYQEERVLRAINKALKAIEKES